MPLFQLKPRRVHTVDIKSQREDARSILGANCLDNTDINGYVPDVSTDVNEDMYKATRDPYILYQKRDQNKPDSGTMELSMHTVV